LKGDFKISLYLTGENDDNELILSRNYKNCQFTRAIKFELPSLDKFNTSGRLYLEIECLSHTGSFKKGELLSPQKPGQKIALAVIVPTFQREEDIKHVLNTIFTDRELCKNDFKVFIVDNGRTLLEKSESKKEFQKISRRHNIRIIENNNLGGAGGFARGILEGLNQNIFTHFLYMDDDIELDPEVLLRTIVVHSYASTNFSISGTMLDGLDKLKIFEAGAFFNRKKVMHFDALHQNTFLPASTGLNYLTKEIKPDYGGFWYFTISRETVQKVGIHLPVFIRMDDAEFGIRITNAGIPIVVFPSIAIWHMPYYTRPLTWQTYYQFRNTLIVNNLYRNHTVFKTALYIFGRIFRDISIFAYFQADLVISGVRDYIRGPKYLKRKNPILLHKEITSKFKKYEIESYKSFSFPPPDELTSETKPSLLFRILYFFTFGGIFFFKKNNERDNKPVFFDINSYKKNYYKCFSKTSCRYFNRYSGENFVYKYNFNTGIKLLLRSVSVLLNLLIKWKTVKKAWKSSVPELSSIEYWRKYLS
jgi:galactofuranosylgalactofuranosylrhamnosyl-N-acetylglucosaminyl-diphospho-decaprenol beta-1,5/1,6-galactofuranosyltransferase